MQEPSCLAGSQSEQCSSAWDSGGGYGQKRDGNATFGSVGTSQEQRLLAVRGVSLQPPIQILQEVEGREA